MYGEYLLSKRKVWDDSLPPVIDTSTCIGCRQCVDACPNDVLALENGVSTVKRPENCEECGLCEAICPQGAITLSEN